MSNFGPRNGLLNCNEQLGEACRRCCAFTTLLRDVSQRSTLQALSAAQGPGVVAPAAARRFWDLRAPRGDLSDPRQLPRRRPSVAMCDVAVRVPRRNAELCRTVAPETPLAKRLRCPGFDGNEPHHWCVAA